MNARGRPKLLQQPTRLNVWMEAAEYDRLYAASVQLGISVPELIRRRLRGEVDAAFAVPKNRQASQDSVA